MIPFIQLFLWNIQFEMELLFKQGTGTLPTPACSDRYVMDSPYGVSLGASGGHKDQGLQFANNKLSGVVWSFIANTNG